MTYDIYHEFQAISHEIHKQRKIQFIPERSQARTGPIIFALLLSTREGEAFLCINGIQTQSARTVNLLGEIDRFIDLGVDVLRISP